MYSAGIGVNSNQAKVCASVCQYVCMCSYTETASYISCFFLLLLQAVVHYVFAALGGHQFAQMAMVRTFYDIAGSEPKHFTGHS